MSLSFSRRRDFPGILLVCMAGLIGSASAQGWSEPWQAIVLHEVDDTVLVETPTGDAVELAFAGLAPPAILLLDDPMLAERSDAAWAALFDHEMLSLALARFLPAGSRIVCRDNGRISQGRYHVVCQDARGRDIGALLIARGVVWVCRRETDTLPAGLDYLEVAKATTEWPQTAPPNIDACMPY